MNSTVQFLSSNSISVQEYCIRLYGRIAAMTEEEARQQFAQSIIIVSLLIWYLYHFYRSDQDHPDLVTRIGRYLRQLVSDFSKARKKKLAQSLKKEQRKQKTSFKIKR